jgi:hypothetical protein
VGLIVEQNVMNCMGVRINPMAQFQPATCLQVQDAECAGYGMDTFLLCVMLARLFELRSVLQGLIPELILIWKCHTVSYMGPICNGR